MVTKDKAYAKHLRQLEADRPKDFALSGNISTANYVRLWCLENGLKHGAEPERMKKAAAPKGKLP